MGGKREKQPCDCRALEGADFHVPSQDTLVEGLFVTSVWGRVKFLHVVTTDTVKMEGLATSCHE